MQDLIKIKSATYKRYEELLVKKNTLLKEAESYGLAYNQIFDELNKEVQLARLECVKKRKIISYCKSVASKGETIIKKALDDFVEKAMQDYQETLDVLSSEEKEEKEIKYVDPENSKRIKITYHQLARLIHPDMNASLKDDPTIQDLWNRTCIAYTCENLEELEELNVLVNKYLESIHRKYVDVEIPDINEKIFNLNKQIYTITHTKPYQYKYFLENEEDIEHKKEELNKELKDYLRYGEELDTEISYFDKFIKNDAEDLL